MVTLAITPLSYVFQDDTFQALYGYVPPRWKEIVQVDAKVPAIRSQLEENHRIMQVLEDN